jgi:hypothetical protein
MEDFHELVLAKPSDVTQSYSVVAYISACSPIRFIARVCSGSARLGDRPPGVQKFPKSHSAHMLEDLPVGCHFQPFQIQLSRRPIMSQEKKERGLVFEFSTPKPEKKVRVEVVLEPALRQLARRKAARNKGGFLPCGVRRCKHCVRPWHKGSGGQFPCLSTSQRRAIRKCC